MSPKFCLIMAILCFVAAVISALSFLVMQDFAWITSTFLFGVGGAFYLWQRNRNR